MDLNECPLTCLHVHCFAFLAGPPQALELNPVVIVTEAAVPLTDHEESFAKHNKFGKFLIPANFLSRHGPPHQHHKLDTSSVDLKKLSNVKGETEESADNAVEEAAKEKKVAKQEARKARRERAKTQQAAAAVAAKEEKEAE
eukprot:scaffold27597_cov61-Phaeocystis_antarctica.AAC.1